MMFAEVDDSDCCNCAYGRVCSECEIVRLHGSITFNSSVASNVVPGDTYFDQTQGDFLKPEEKIRKRIEARKARQINDANRLSKKELEKKKIRLERAREFLEHPYMDLKPEEGAVPVYLMLKFMHDNRLMLKRYMEFLDTYRGSKLDDIVQLEDLQEVFNQLIVKQVQEE